MKKKNISDIPEIKMFLVICGDSDIHKSGAHAALCFNIDVALAEKESMEKTGYLVKGIFEISTLNILNKIPYYLKV